MLLFNKVRVMDGLANEGGDGSGGTSTPPPANNSTPPPSAPPSITWDQVKSVLPKEYQEDPSLKTINSVDGLVKSYIHSQKAIGNKIPVPDKHATPDDWAQIFKKLGNPEKLEEYNLNLPKEAKLDEAFLGEIKKAAHSAGVLPFQMEKVLSTYFDYASKQMQESATKLEAQEKEDIENLKKEWGEAYDTQVKKANVAFKELVPNQADRERLINDGLANHPVVLKMLTQAAKYFKEDTFIGHGEGDLGGMTPADALSKAREIQGNKDHPYRNPTHPNHKAAKEEVQKLYKIAFPE
jgi:hypothetical protein